MGAYNMNATAFTQQVEAMSNRLANLYQGASPDFEGIKKRLSDRQDKLT